MIVNGRAIDGTDHTAQLQGTAVSNITSFAEDGRGSPYLLEIGGAIGPIRLREASGDRLSGDDRLYDGAGTDRMAVGSGLD